MIERRGTWKNQSSGERESLMTRSDLIGRLAVSHNIHFRKAEAVINQVFGSMADTLVAGNRIEIRGFGSFEIREYEGHTGRNPKTGKEVVVKSKKLPFFKVGKDLKERVKGSVSEGIIENRAVSGI